VNLLLNLNAVCLIVLFMGCEGRPTVFAERKTLTSVMAAGPDPLRDHEVDDSLVDGLVDRIDELNQDRCLSY